MFFFLFQTDFECNIIDYLDLDYYVGLIFLIKFHYLQTDIKLHKSAKSILTKPLKSENPEDFKQKRKNKNLSKLKKYKKRQLKKKHSSKQITNERKIIKTSNEIQEEALNYLRIWHEDYENWKFKKLLQSWLIKNALNRKMVS